MIRLENGLEGKRYTFDFEKMLAVFQGVEIKEMANKKVL